MKKESYKHNLPHFQQPGQAYFVTWILKDAVPRKALVSYSQKLEQLKNQMKMYENDDSKNVLYKNIQNKYYSIRRKYIYAYDSLLAESNTKSINLLKPENLKIIAGALHFWEGLKLKNIAYSIMPNHVHWVLEIAEYDEKGNSIFLQDILQSVKRFTANKINKIEGRSGTLWQKESFDTTIRDDIHLYNAVEYTLNNPVKAGFVADRSEWPGNFLCRNF